MSDIAKELTDTIADLRKSLSEFDNCLFEAEKHDGSFYKKRLADARKLSVDLGKKFKYFRQVSVSYGKEPSTTE